MSTKERIIKLIKFFSDHRNDSMKTICAVQGDDGLFPFNDDRFTDEALEVVANVFKWNLVLIGNPHLKKIPKVGVDLVEALERRNKNPSAKLYNWVRPGKDSTEEIYE